MRNLPLRALWAAHDLTTDSSTFRPGHGLLGPRDVITGREDANASSAPAAPGNYSIYDKLPGLWFETCLDSVGTPPCTAYCRKNDTTCQEIGTDVVSSCNEIWSTYNGNRLRSESPAFGWSTVYSTYGQSAGLSTKTVKVYTSFSTASISVIKQNKDSLASGMVTITPVYAMGNPVKSVYVTTMTAWTKTNSWLTAPLPSCRYIGLSTTNNCGKCSIYGGTVDLYFWPPATAVSSKSSMMTEPASLILSEGVTLYSPTVYISLTTVYARNSCSFVGSNHTGTLVPMHPTDVSTQVHIGGKVAATGAYYYGQVDYADLMGVPPVIDYQNQPSCVRFGCPTIYPTYSPTLVVPMALRSLNTDWKDCVSALEGLYDPPIALTAAPTAESITEPDIVTTSGDRTASLPVVTTSAASQCSTPTAPTPTATPRLSEPALASTGDSGGQTDSMSIIEPSSMDSTQRAAYQNAIGPLQSALESRSSEHTSSAETMELPYNLVRTLFVPGTAKDLRASYFHTDTSEAEAAVVHSTKDTQTRTSNVVQANTPTPQHGSTAAGGSTAVLANATTATIILDNFAEISDSTASSRAHTTAVATAKASSESIDSSGAIRSWPICWHVSAFCLLFCTLF